MLSKLTKTYLGATIPVVNVCGVIKPQLYSSRHPAPNRWKKDSKRSIPPEQWPWQSLSTRQVDYQFRVKSSLKNSRNSPSKRTLSSIPLPETLPLQAGTWSFAGEIT